MLMTSGPVKRRSADNLTEEGANELARRVRAFWAERGFVVETQVHRVGNRQSRAYAVTSDMRNGLPVRRAS